MRRLFIIFFLLFLQVPMLGQTPVNVNMSGGITITKESDNGLNHTYISNQDLYKKIEKAALEAEARQRQSSPRNNSSNNDDAEYQAEQARKRAEREARMEMERRKEQARIQAAGDEYVRSTASYYQSLKDNAYWESTVGKEIVREKTARENFFTPGIRIIESDGSAPIQPIKTETDKTIFSSKMMQKKGETFKSLNIDPPYYSPDFNIGHFREALQKTSPIPESVSAPFVTGRMSQPTFLDKARAWAKSTAILGRNTLLDEAIGRVEGVFESVVSQTTSAGSGFIRMYKTMTSVFHVGDLECNIIDNNLDALLTSVRTGDYEVLNRSLADTEFKTRKQLYKSIRDGFGQTSSTNDAIDEGVNNVSVWTFWKLWEKE